MTSPAIEQAAASTRTEQDVLDARKAKTAHTAGPWSIRTKRGKPLWVDGKVWVDGPTGLNSNVVGEKFGPPICEVHNEADARLIATAPSMFEFVDLISHFTTPGKDSDDDAETLANLISSAKLLRSMATGAA